jgi:hypothetical protein
MNFKTFDFIHFGEKLIIQCKKCDAGEIDYYKDTEQKSYRAKGWANALNDCRSDVDLYCHSCGNSESAESLNIMFIGR